MESIEIARNYRGLVWMEISLIAHEGNLILVQILIFNDIRKLMGRMAGVHGSFTVLYYENSMMKIVRIPWMSVGSRWLDSPGGLM